METIEKLAIGNVVSTMSVHTSTFENENFADFCQNSLNRHKNCDWGDLEEEDIESNNFALENKERILSSYNLPRNIKIAGESKLWIITEWDRSLTTILFPSDY